MEPALVEEDVAGLGDVQHYLRGLAPKPRTNFCQRFRGAPKEAIELLDCMLIFNPAKRIDVEQALEHPFLSSVRKPEKEIVADHDLIMHEDFLNMTKEQFKQRLTDEIKSFSN